MTRTNKCPGRKSNRWNIGQECSRTIPFRDCMRRWVSKPGPDNFQDLLNAMDTADTVPEAALSQ